MDNQKKTEILVVENRARHSRLATLDELLKYEFIIPMFQRPYAWDAENFNSLLETIEENMREGREAFFGSVIVARRGSDNLHEHGLIDGQQRITSFLILLRFFNEILKTKQLKIQEDIKEKENLKKELIHKTIEARNGAVLLDETLDEIKYLDKEDELCGKLLRDIRELVSGRIKRESGGGVEQSERDVLKYIETGDSKYKMNFLKKSFSFFEEVWTPDSDLKEIESALSYIFQKCSFCFLVITGDEDYTEEHAIDIFNALNSTGEPLSAFEILKSSVAKKFKNSERVEVTSAFKSIEDDLLVKSRVARRSYKKYTDRLILFMWMSNNNLRKECDNISSFRGKRALINNVVGEKNIKQYVDYLRSMHAFIYKNWRKDRGSRDIIKTMDLESQILFDFLYGMSHDRVIPTIYYYREDRELMEEAIKICVAFTCLWRGYAANASTDSIDKQYEEVTGEIYGATNFFDIGELKNHLIERLSKRFKNKDNWVKQFSRIDISKNRRMSRFLLLLAFHNKVFNQGRLDEAGRGFLTAEGWFEKEYGEAECISPQSQKIGNLIFLPGDIKKGAGAKSFVEKQKIYRVYVKEKGGSENPYLTILGEVTSYGESDITNAGYLADATIERRGVRLGDSIWKALAEDILGWH